MKIFKQYNSNECGICVIQSLVHFFYKKSISTIEIYDKANITRNGISIYDLEKLGNIYGLKLDSYEINFEDFLEYKENNFFVLLLKKEDGMHYVIAKKKNDKIILYDSAEGKKCVNAIDIKEQFTNIIIFVDKIKVNDIFFQKVKIKDLNFNWKYLSLILLIDIFVLILSILIGFVTRSIFSLVIANNDFENLAYIIFLSIFIYLANNIGNFLIQFLKSKQFNNYQKELTNYFIDSLYLKNNNFFSKITQSQLLVCQQHINVIANYYSRFINTWIIDIITLSISIIFILFFQWQFIFILIFAILLEIIYSKISIYFNKKYLGRIYQNQNNQKKIFFSLENFLNNELNFEKLKEITFFIKNNVFEEIQINKKINFFNSFLSKFNQLLMEIINLAIYILGAYIISNFQLEIGNLILITIFYQFANKAVLNLVNFYIFKINFNYSNIYFFNLINSSNSKNEGFKWNKLEKIKIENLSFFYDDKKIFENLNLEIKANTFIYGKSGTGKSTLYHLIRNYLIPTKGKIYFNKYYQSNLNQIFFNRNVIYQISESYMQKNDWDSIFSSISENELEKIFEIMREINLEIKNNYENDKLSSGQKQFLNILNLINYKNKLIILDECFNHINETIKNKLISTIIPILTKNNFLICSEHDLNLKKYFENCINLEKIEMNKNEMNL